MCLLPFISINAKAENNVNILKEGETRDISFIATEPVTYSSTDETVATVSQKGVVKAIKEGTCKIELTSKVKGYVIAFFPIQVTPSSVKLNKTTLTLSKGDSETLILYNAKKVSFSSSNSKIATVTKNGKVKAVKEGYCVITAKDTRTGKKYKCKVTVNPIGDDEDLLTDVEVVDIENVKDIHDKLMACKGNLILDLKTSDKNEAEKKLKNLIDNCAAYNKNAIHFTHEALTKDTKGKYVKEKTYYAKVSIYDCQIYKYANAIIEESFNRFKYINDPIYIEAYKKAEADFESDIIYNPLSNFSDYAGYHKKTEYLKALEKVSTNSFYDLSDAMKIYVLSFAATFYPYGFLDLTSNIKPYLDEKKVSSFIKYREWPESNLSFETKQKAAASLINMCNYNAHGVCHNFAQTEVYIFNLLGIESKYAASEKMNHAYTVVKCKNNSGKILYIPFDYMIGFHNVSLSNLSSDINSSHDKRSFFSDKWSSEMELKQFIYNHYVLNTYPEGKLFTLEDILN